MNFEQVFQAFSKLGKKASDGTSITLLQVNQWLRQAGMINIPFSTSDTAVHFNKFKTKEMDQKTFEAFLKMLCRQKKLNVNTIKRKLVEAGLPGLIKSSDGSNLDVGARLSDTLRPATIYRKIFSSAARRAIAGPSDKDKSVVGHANKNTTNKGA